MNICVIPARGGSKRIPRKNIKSFCGQPMVAYSIVSALESKIFDHIIVSTDDDEIAEVSLKYGASVPFIRPEEFASDDASLISVVKHAWESHLTSDGNNFDYIVLLQPTSPLRDVFHIKEAIELYFNSCKSENDTLASVYKVDKKNGWLLQSHNNDQYINFCFNVDLSNPQRQKLKPLYLPNGAIFIIRGDSIERGIYHKNTIPFVMDEDDSEDIDTIEDFRIVENILLNKFE